MPFDLFSTLIQGRYLIETKHNLTQTYSYIYLWILNDNTFFKHLKYNLNSNANTIHVKLSLNDFYLDKNTNSKKIMYTYSDSNLNTNDFKKLYNDVNIEILTVSNEYFALMLDMLKSSTSQLCESLKISNEHYFAII